MGRAGVGLDQTLALPRSLPKSGSLMAAPRHTPTDLAQVSRPVSTHRAPGGGGTPSACRSKLPAPQGRFGWPW